MEQCGRWYSRQRAARYYTTDIAQNAWWRNDETILILQRSSRLLLKVFNRLIKMLLCAITRAVGSDSRRCVEQLLRSDAEIYPVPGQPANSNQMIRILPNLSRDHQKTSNRPIPKS